MGALMLSAALFAAPAMVQDVVPTKSNFACTVLKGMVQIEADTSFNWLRTTAAGVRTDQLLFTNPTFK
jgi:hypothetical protein